MKKIALKNAARGTAFDYAGQSWILLENDDGRALCLSKDIIETRAFDEGNCNNFAVASSNKYLNGPYWSAATKEVLVQKLAAYENTGYEPDEIRAAIEQAAKNSETKTATIMAECIAGAMKDTLEKYGTAGSGKKGETP